MTTDEHEIQQPAPVRPAGRDPLLPRAGGRVAARGDHHAPSVPERYAHAHVAALRATAALLAARAQPGAAGPARRAQKNAWVLLAEVAPGARRVGGVLRRGRRQAGRRRGGSRRAVTEREADDLVRDADRFLALVEDVARADPARPVPRPACSAGR